MTQRTFGHWLWLAPLCNVGITSAGAKAFHLNNNNKIMVDQIIQHQPFPFGNLACFLEY